MSDPQAGAVPPDPFLIDNLKSWAAHVAQRPMNAWELGLAALLTQAAGEIERLRALTPAAGAVPDGITALLEAFEQAYADALEPGPNQRGRMVIFTQIDVPTFIEGLRNAVAARSVVAPKSELIQARNGIRDALVKLRGIPATMDEADRALAALDIAIGMVGMTTTTPLTNPARSVVAPRHQNPMIHRLKDDARGYAALLSLLNVDSYDDAARTIKELQAVVAPREQFSYTCPRCNGSGIGLGLRGRCDDCKGEGVLVGVRAVVAPRVPRETPDDEETKNDLTRGHTTGSQ